MTSLFNNDTHTEARGGSFWTTLTLSVLVLALVISNSWTYTAMRKSQKLAQMQASAATKPGTAAQNPPAPKADKPPTPPAATSPVASTDIVGNREGIEHPLIRQLVANPNLCDHTKKCHPFLGNRDDGKAVKHWAGIQAHLLAIKGGKVEWKFGEQMVVNAPNTVAYVIEEDATGDLTIGEYAVSTPPGQTGTLTYTHVKTDAVATTIAASHFEGPMDGSTTFRTPYEHMQT